MKIKRDKIAATLVVVFIITFIFWAFISATYKDKYDNFPHDMMCENIYLGDTDISATTANNKENYDYISKDMVYRMNKIVNEKYPKDVERVVREIQDDEILEEPEEEGE